MGALPALEASGTLLALQAPVASNVVTLLVALASFGFGFLTSAAQTWCLIAIERRAAVRAAWWDMVICASSLIVIYTHNWLAFVTYMVGSAWATWWSVRRAKGKEAVC